MAEIRLDDLRAAVAAGMMTEAQAARLTTLAEMRAGFRGAMTDDDEPFELFRGFNEVFTAVGVGLFGFGLWAVAFLLTAGTTAPAALTAFACWLLAEYLTRRRRMVLPSLMLALGFTGAVAIIAGGAGLTWLLETTEPGALSARLAAGEAPAAIGAATALAGAAAALAFYLRFRLPFAVFLVGLGLFAATLTVTGVLHPENWGAVAAEGPGAVFDLGNGGVAWATLGFGIAAFLAAMAFDMRDPHRLSRHSACGFWLHLIAAPAIVNTAATTLWSQGGAVGAAMTLLTVAALALVALVIDRRGFLIASVVYMGLLLSTLFDGFGPMAAPAAILALGAALTALGAFWTRARSALMAALPDFPGKDRLPPYAELT